MTPDEQHALRRMESKMTTLTQAVAELTQLKPVMERVSRSLVGDEEYGIIGLVDDHHALKLEVREYRAEVEAELGEIRTYVDDELEAIKVEIKDVSAISSAIRNAITWVGRKWPYVGIAAFLYVTGGDMAAVWRFVEGIMR